MSGTPTPQAARDGNGTPLPGGLKLVDLSATGVGPWLNGLGLVDGLAGVNVAQVTAANALKTESGGAAAHDSAVSGNPVRAAARARSSNYTATSSDDTADLITTLVGALITRPYSIPEAEWSYVAAASGIVNSAAAVTLAAAPAAGLRNYLTALEISAEALGTATEIAVRDDAGGTVIWRAKIGTSGLPLVCIRFPTPLKSSVAKLLEFVTLTASGTGAVYVNAQGYVAP